MSSPRVSVVMPAYNAARWLQEALDSVWSQTFSDFECIVVDDGSTDETAAILSRQQDPRLRILRNPTNLGLTRSLNRGLEAATGVYIARMDADDICMPERFERQVGFLDTHPGVAVVDCIMEYISEEGHPSGDVYSDLTSHEAISRTIPFRNCVGHSSVMYRREVADLRYRDVPLEDLDLWLRVIGLGWRIERIPEKLLYYRMHGSSYTQQARREETLFRRFAETKRRYLAGLPLSRRFDAFSIRLMAGIGLDYLTVAVKKMRSAMRA